VRERERERREKNVRQRMKKKETDTSRQLNYQKYLTSSAVVTLFLFKSNQGQEIVLEMICAFNVFSNFHIKKI